MDKGLQEKIKATAKRLRPLTPVAQKLLASVNDDAASANDVATILSGDLALASKTLELVNSSFYGLSRRVSTISRAVVILGNKAVRNLALAFSCQESLRDIESPLDQKRFWRHSSFAATASQVLARRTGYGMPEEAFMAGLLHDIGRLLLAASASKEYPTSLNFFDGPIEQWELNHFGADHCEVGYLLMTQWNLPPQLCDATQAHHGRDNFSKASATLVNIVRAADTLTLLFGEDGQENISGPNACRWIKTLNIAPFAYRDILQETRRRETILCEFLRVAPENMMSPFPEGKKKQIVYWGTDSARFEWLTTMFGFWDCAVKRSPPGEMPAPPPDLLALDGGGGLTAEKAKEWIGLAKKQNIPIALTFPETEAEQSLAEELSPTLSALPFVLTPHQCRELLENGRLAPE